MSVISVQEKFDRRRSQKRLEGNATVTTHTRVWIVKCSEATDGTAAAIEAETIPRLGEPHPTDYDATCRGVEADPLNRDSHHFEVVAEYSDETDGGEEDRETPPLERAWDISWGGSASTGAYFYDVDEQPVTNSAGEPFEGMLERDTSELVISIVKNEERGDPGLDDLFSNTINENDVVIAGTVFLEGTLKLSPIQATKTIERVGSGTVTYWRKTYELKARRQGWDDVVEDRGFNERVSGEVDTPDGPTTVYKLRPILDTNAQRIRKPAHLNGEGLQLAADAPAPVELIFKPYRRADWTTLGFAA